MVPKPLFRFCLVWTPASPLEAPAFNPSAPIHTELLSDLRGDSRRAFGFQSSLLTAYKRMALHDIIKRQLKMRVGMGQNQTGCFLAIERAFVVCWVRGNTDAFDPHPSGYRQVLSSASCNVRLVKFQLTSLAIWNLMESIGQSLSHMCSRPVTRHHP